MQGFNMGRYHPPDSLDKSLSSRPTGSFNKTYGGQRIPTGPPTIRFEMPFAIWCTTCSPEAIIGQGVRFNAKKIKVGMYYTSPIWAFEMKHTTCGGLIEIRTDPKSTEYIVTRGARRRDYGDEDVGETLLGVVVSEEEKRRREVDPFASLEGRVAEGVRAKDENWWVEKLVEERDRDWDDVWTANRRLRKGFREEKKVLQAKEKVRGEITERLGLSIELLDEIKEDGQHAALITFGETNESAKQKVVEVAARPLFEESKQASFSGKVKKTKAQLQADQSKATLQHSLQRSTRAVVDPFLSNGSNASKAANRLAGIKRKRIEAGGQAESDSEPIKVKDTRNDEDAKVVPKGLVDYDSE
jgi:coiled-coil domain-containing protein 130